jgi:colanic acid/amylovoran biosynthesis glycosyltransferase
MKILYVTTVFPFGFDEVFLDAEIATVAANGNDVLIVPRSPSREIFHPAHEAWSKHAIARGLMSWPIVWGAFRMAVRAPRRALAALRWLLRSRSPSILLKNLAVYPKGLWLAGIAREWKADHMHAHWAGTTATMAGVAAQVSGISWSIATHRWDIVDNNLLGEKMRVAAFTTFISKSGLELARTCLGGSPPPNRAFILRVGCRLPPREKMLPGPTNSNVVLCPASLLPVKGHRYLIDALALLTRQGREVELWLAGDGELHDALLCQVRELGLEQRVRFLGRVPNQDVIGYYRTGKIGIVALPSVDLGGGLHEGVPVSLMEAMSYGVPVVSTATGGIPELLREGAGLLVPPADPAALADAIGRLLQDPDLRSRCGRLGRERVEAEYDVQANASELARRFETGRLMR